MNIKQAKDQIRNAVKAYSTTNKYGRPIISKQRQRPIFLIGAPGIGKTAIVEQIAKELGIGLVSYSITHHTRQSALGLPFIKDKEYNGKTYRISEYTMSEIIASIYEKMEETGVNKGILFLDEINCVSETLSPAMLQFLQYKVFGQHHVPDGWIVVTAGNPMEYNQSVHEFDMVTQDRLKRIDIEPDYNTWREWAINENIHPCVLSYLDIRKDEFYKVETTIDGKSFVTPRGWVDLSDMMKLYEMNNIEIDELLVRQYLQNDFTAKQFYVYFELWKKYQSDYKVYDILNGQVSDEIIGRARNSSMDERISLLGLLIDAIKNDMQPIVEKRITLIAMKKLLNHLHNNEINIQNHINEIIHEQKEKLNVKELLNENQEDEIYAYIEILDHILNLIDDKNYEESIVILKDWFIKTVNDLDNEANKVSSELENIFDFLQQAFEKGSEILMFVTELTASNITARFIGSYGSKSYYKYNKELLFYERSKEILNEIDNLLDF